MSMGIWDDTEGSDDRLKDKADRHASESWRGQWKNTHFFFTQTQTNPCVVLFSCRGNLVRTSVPAQGS